MRCSHRETWGGQNILWTAETSVSQPFLLTGWPLLSDEGFLLLLVFSALRQTHQCSSNWSACGHLYVLRSCWRTESLGEPEGAEVWAGFYLLSTVITFHYFMSLPHEYPPHTYMFLFSIWKIENPTVPLSGLSSLHQRFASSSLSSRTETGCFSSSGRSTVVIRLVLCERSLLYHPLMVKFTDNY